MTRWWTCTVTLLTCEGGNRRDTSECKLWRRNLSATFLNCSGSGRSCERVCNTAPGQHWRMYMTMSLYVPSCPLRIHQVVWTRNGSLSEISTFAGETAENECFKLLMSCSRHCIPHGSRWNLRCVLAVVWGRKETGSQWIAPMSHCIHLSWMPRKHSSNCREWVVPLVRLAI